MIQNILIIILLFLLVLENVILVIVFKKMYQSIKKDMANQFIEAYQKNSGTKLNYKQEKRLISQLTEIKPRSEKMKNKK